MGSERSEWSEFAMARSRRSSPSQPNFFRRTLPGSAKLDDGWPESIEEQGLLLLVWRHNFTNNVLKMCYRQSRRGVSRRNSEKCKTIVCIANTLTHRSFYTQTLLPHKSFYTQKLLHTEAFTHKSFHTQTAFTDRHFHTQTLLHTKAFTHRSFYTQTLLHTDPFTHRRFYTQTLLHTDAFYTQALLHTETFTHRDFYTQRLLPAETFTHRRFYTQRLLHTNAFTHRRFLHTDALTHKHIYTQTLLHTDAFTRRRLYTQKLLHTNAFTHRRFYIQTLLRRNTFTHRRFYTQTALHTSAFTHNHLYTQTLLHTGRPMYSQRSHRCRGHLSNPTGWCGEVLFPCDSKPACINMSWGLCALGPSTKVVCHLLKKKSKRADLAGGERFWAGTRTVLQYDISWFFMGLGSWLVTVTGIETLILTLIHPSLYINSHTSISISYL